MSKFDLRDISERLAGSSDTEAVVSEFIGYLQSTHADWRAALAFYEVSRDALVSVYERQGTRLVQRDVSVPVEQLPARLVRKFFHPSAFFNSPAPATALMRKPHASTFYEPDPTEAPSLRPLVPIPNWRSCVCLRLANRDDMLALLVLVSSRKGAFGTQAIEEVIPLKSMAALALAQRLDRAARGPGGEAGERDGRRAAEEFHERLSRLSAHARELEEENQAKSQKLNALEREIESLDQASSHYRQQLENVKSTLVALEARSAAATQRLGEASSRLAEAQTRLKDHERTIDFMRYALPTVCEDRDVEGIARAIISRLCRRFAVKRCSLMLLDEGGETLRVAAQRGIEPEVAGRVRVRVGQGISGWVALNRKPLLVRTRDESPAVSPAAEEPHDGDSFISVPVIYNDRLAGVLNISDKRGGKAFDEIDLERAQMAAAVLALALGVRAQAGRVAA